jgi:hypothetical protein
MFKNEVIFTDDDYMHKLQEKLEVFEDEVLSRQKEILRAYVGLQKENMQMQRRLNETVS